MIGKKPSEYIVTRLLLVATGLFLTHGALAAGSTVDDDVNAELDRMYQTSKQQNNSATAQQKNNNNSDRIVIVPQQTTTTTVVQDATQKQAATVIEATPLVESKAERIRKARQDEEVNTEQKIVEKLELSRMQDERRRSEVLFGDKFNQIMNKDEGSQQQQQTVVIAAPTPAPTPLPVPTPYPTPVAVAPAPLVAPPDAGLDKETKEADEDKMDRDAVRGEISAALADLKKADDKPKDRLYMGALLGIGEYSGVSNLKSNYAAGFSVGEMFNSNVQVEGSFIYSSYQVEQVCVYCGQYVYGTYYPTITNMDQYQGVAAVKYQIGSAQLRPNVGLGLAYTYRTFTDTQFSRGNSNATSTALDLSGILGLDLMVTESFSVGLDYRYYTNISNQNSGSFQQSYVNGNQPGTKPIETVNYYTFGLVGKTTF